MIFQHNISHSVKQQQQQYWRCVLTRAASASVTHGLRQARTSRRHKNNPIASLSVGRAVLSRAMSSISPLGGATITGPRSQRSRCHEALRARFGSLMDVCFAVRDFVSAAIGSEIIAVLVAIRWVLSRRLVFLPEKHGRPQCSKNIIVEEIFGRDLREFDLLHLIGVRIPSANDSEIGISEFFPPKKPIVAGSRLLSRIA